MKSKLLSFVALAGLAAGPAMADYSGLPRTFLWNPDYNQMIDTSQFAKEGPYTIGFSNASQADLWLVTFFHGVQWAADRNRDKLARFIVTDANSDPTKQVSDIQDLLNQDIDLLLVNPATADALDPILRRTMRSGVPVVTAARRVESDDSFVSFVTASDTALARMSATWMAETLGGEGRVVLLPGLAGASPAEMRLNAAREVFAQFPGIEIVDTQYTSWSPANGKQIMSAIIQREGADTIDGVWADSGLQGSGSVEAFLNAGVASSDIPPHTGGDLNRMYKLALEHGFPFAGIDYTPSIGISAVGLALDVLEGASVPKRLDVNFQVVISEGDETESIKADVMLADYVAVDRPDDFIMGHGMGPDYDPKTFSVDLPN
ncbi:MAG: substrate-binding domain-containing protein [Gammaproteobacteria bacterium]|nr:substrate-binding domain-containing protein [Gammaproteobacteria bacterium]MYG65626.1 substrate-binding domain-containing protein [Gammaproteobacteria bacterium]